MRRVMPFAVLPAVVLLAATLLAACVVPPPQQAAGPDASAVDAQTVTVYKSPT